MSGKTGNMETDKGERREISSRYVWREIEKLAMNDEGTVERKDC